MRVSRALVYLLIGGLIAWSASALSALPVSAAGEVFTSFDCQKAQKPATKTICASKVLGRLDRKLDSYYDEALRTVGDPQALKAAQREWLAERNACGADADCIEKRYRERIDTLLDHLPYADKGPRYRVAREDPAHEVSDDGNTIKEFDDLCESVVDALNRMQPVQRQVCGFEVPADAESVGTPDWQRVDPREYLDVLRAAVRVRDENLTKERQREKWAQNKAAIESGEARVWRAEFDLDNEDGEEVVLRHELFQCTRDTRTQFAGGQHPGLSVLTDDGKALADGYSRLHELPYWVPFFYADQTWLWKWRGLRNEAADAYVHEALRPRDQFSWSHKANCEIDYVE